MNRFSVVGITFLLVSTAFSADNVWDGNDYGYDGAFGLSDGSSPDWSSATEIWTIRTPSADDTPSGALGYLGLLNNASTTVTVTNSFTGQISMANGTGSVITNRIVSLDEGVEVTGSAANVSGGSSASSSYAISIAGMTDDTVVLEEGRYVGGQGYFGISVTGIGTLRVEGANVVGGSGASYSSDGSGSITFGSVGLQQTVGTLVVDSTQSESDVIQGGNGGDDLYGYAAGTVSAYGGDAVYRIFFCSSMTMESGRVVGGSGGNLVSDGSLSFYLYGGDGIKSGRSSYTLNGGYILGGSGGTADVNAIGAGSTVYGGDAVDLGSSLSDSFVGSASLEGGGRRYCCY